MNLNNFNKFMHYMKIRNCVITQATYRVYKPARRHKHLIKHCSSKSGVDINVALFCQWPFLTHARECVEG